VLQILTAKSQRVHFWLPLRSSGLSGESAECWESPRANSLETLELFRSDPRGFDLIVTDMTMPGMTGDKLTLEFLRIRKDIPIVLCTGYSEEITEEDAKALGIRALVMKPVLISRMARAVREA